MENTIEQIKSLVNTLNLQNTPLMEKPSEYELKYVSTDISKGKYIKTHTKNYGSSYWRYPNGIEEKIEDDNGYLWIPQVIAYRENTNDWIIPELGSLNDITKLEGKEVFKVIRWMPIPLDDTILNIK